MSENDKKLISRSRSSKPSLELYKPPVLRGKKSLPRKVQDVQSESLEKNIQKEISLLSLNEENKEEASQLPKSQLKIPSKSTEIPQKCQKQLIKKSEEKAKPSMNFDDLINNLRLFLSKDLQNGNEIGEFLILNCSPEMAKYVGIFIVKYLVEDCCKNNKKYLKKGILSKLYTSLFNTPIFKYFYNGIILSFERYFECKNELRNLEEIKEEENNFYFLVWQNFIFLIFELAQICNEEGIISLIFNIFDYLLNEPVLNSLKIFELESILSLLMIIGHRLELDYPLQTDELRILLRNASLNSTECWARKMILLMVELGAVNWKIVPQIEEFYYTL
uniref:Uncharacterized protein n=1 Tax=Meloidogyne enterolobii TaxID=390850 RepID=A0A6V7Y0Z7_MELEN|nr:unnamed protein product [Meloidogyne enterolobii]